jgi:vacuolar-type H+-ATPase subunit I/STV1
VHGMVHFFLSFFALLVFVLAEIHHTAHWRVNVRGYLNEVIALFRSQFDGFSGLENSQLFALTVDDSDAGRLDSVIDPLSVGLFFYVRILLAKLVLHALQLFGAGIFYFLNRCLQRHKAHILS